MLIVFLRGLFDRDSRFTYSEEQWKLLLDDILLFEIAAQVYHFLKRFERLDETPVFFIERLKEITLRVCHQNLLIKTETEALLKLFEGQCIPAIPLKGTRFAEKYFGHLAARGTSDIDILVPELQMAGAIDFANKLGYQLIPYRPGHHNVTMVKASGNLDAPLELELHQHIMDPKTCRMPVESLWSNSMSAGKSGWVRELSVKQTFYLICLHGIKHRMDSLKYILDVVQLIEYGADQLDYERLLNQAEEDQTKSRIVGALSIVYSCFPHLHRIKPFSYAKHAPFWSYPLILRLNKKDNLLKSLFNHVFPLFYMDTWQHRYRYLSRLLMNFTFR